MAQTPLLQHERVDDVPVIIGLANRLRVAEVLHCHLGTCLLYTSPSPRDS